MQLVKLIKKDCSNKGAVHRLTGSDIVKQNDVNRVKSIYRHNLERSSDNRSLHKDRPLQPFLSRISHIQKLELAQKEKDENYEPVLRVSIVTARNAPSHKRVINTMREWDIMVNDAFFMGGVDKHHVLKVLKPHIFFDDQQLHLEQVAAELPSVHIPFGVTNRSA